MFKVLMADDEALFRIYMKSLFNWNQYGFEIVGEAENGQSAVKLAEELRPDIIIMDVKMPLLDGIESIKKIKQLNDKVKFIMLSGYCDFDYVKEAMKIGAADYILKINVEADKVIEILLGIKKKIIKEREYKEYNNKIHEIEKICNSNLPALKEKFFKDLIFGYLNADQIIQQLKFLNIILPENDIVCMVIRISDLNTVSKYDKNDVFILFKSIEDMLNNFISEYEYMYLFSDHTSDFVIIGSGAVRGSGEVMEYFMQISRNVMELLRNYFNLSALIGISNKYKGLCSIKEAYKEALKAIDGRFVYAGSSILTYKEIDQRIENIFPYFDNELEMLENALNILDIASLDKVLSNIILKLRQYSHISRESISGICCALLLLVSKFLKDFDLSFEDVCFEGYDPYKKIDHLLTFSDFTEWFQEFQGMISDLISCADNSKIIILKAKKFINKHYVENLCLQAVAEHLNISSNYLSTIFKKETGENFIDYLTSVRINHAKRLLMHHDYKVYEVSIMVGYDNFYYFSRLFKKLTGSSPIKYKSQKINLRG